MKFLVVISVVKRGCKKELFDHFFPIPSNFSNNLCLYQRRENSFSQGQIIDFSPGGPQKGFQPSLCPTPTPSKNILFEIFDKQKEKEKPQKGAQNTPTPSRFTCALNIIY